MREAGAVRAGSWGPALAAAEALTFAPATWQSFYVTTFLQQCLSLFPLVHPPIRIRMCIETPADIRYSSVKSCVHLCVKLVVNSSKDSGARVELWTSSVI